MHPTESPDVKFLDLVNCPNSNCRVRGKSEAVFVGFCVERTHVFDLLKVDITEHQLLVAAVDDGGSVTAGEHVAHGAGAELAEDDGLRREDHLLLVRQVSRLVDNKVK